MTELPVTLAPATPSHNTPSPSLRRFASNRATLLAREPSQSSMSATFLVPGLDPFREHRSNSSEDSPRTSAAALSISSAGADPSRRLRMKQRLPRAASIPRAGIAPSRGGSTSSVERCRARGRRTRLAERAKGPGLATQYMRRRRADATRPQPIQTRGAAHSVCRQLRARLERSFEGEPPLLHVSAREPVGHAHDRAPRRSGRRAPAGAAGERTPPESSHHATQIAIDGRRPPVRAKPSTSEPQTFTSRRRTATRRPGPRSELAPLRAKRSTSEALATSSGSAQIVVRSRTHERRTRCTHCMHRDWPGAQFANTNHCGSAARFR
jgi:hypothetical protein